MEIRTAAGRISAYGFACGYVESVYHGRVNVCLWSEHGTYHVRAHDHENKRRVFWDSFRLLSDARKHFDHSRALIVAHNATRADEVNGVSQLEGFARLIMAD